MKVEIRKTPLNGNHTMTLYELLINDKVYLRQISAIGAFDVTVTLEDSGRAGEVEYALTQLGLKPWGRELRRPVLAHRSTPQVRRGPGRASTGYISHHEDIPSRIPAEQATKVRVIDDA